MTVFALALEAGLDTESKEVLLQGFIRNDAWNWTIGGLIYASTTAGGLSQTAPSDANDVVQIVGVATAADEIYFKPEYATIVIAE
jgi:hypothetical protein